jgi:hypothetical protein
VFLVKRIILDARDWRIFGNGRDLPDGQVSRTLCSPSDASRAFWIAGERATDKRSLATLSVIVGRSRSEKKSFGP